MILLGFEYLLCNNNGPQMCPLCKLHFDSQPLSFQCPQVIQNVKIEGKYTNIFCRNPDIKLVKTLLNVSKYRDKYIQSRQLKQP